MNIINNNRSRSHTIVKYAIVVVVVVNINDDEIRYNNNNNNGHHHKNNVKKRGWNFWMTYMWPNKSVCASDHCPLSLHFMFLDVYLNQNWTHDNHDNVFWKWFFLFSFFDSLETYVIQLNIFMKSFTSSSSSLQLIISSFFCWIFAERTDSLFSS